MYVADVTKVTLGYGCIWPGTLRRPDLYSRASIFFCKFPAVFVPTRGTRDCALAARIGSGLRKNVAAHKRIPRCLARSVRRVAKLSRLRHGATRRVTRTQFGTQKSGAVLKVLPASLQALLLRFSKVICAPNCHLADKVGKSPMDSCSQSARSNGTGRNTRCLPVRPHLKPPAGDTGGGRLRPRVGRLPVAHHAAMSRGLDLPREKSCDRA
jgi:hypothetical protein